MSKVVKNISNQDLSIPNIGLVKSGETIKVENDFHNANFEVVKEVSEKSEVVKNEKIKK